LAEAKLAFRRLLLRFPTWLLYFLSVLAFWPTTVLALCKARFCSKSYRRWDRISEGVILGAAPLWTDDVWRLKREENVTGVINCCREWDGHKSLYPRLGLIQLHLPTIDFFPPTYADCMRGAEFIHSRVARSGTGRNLYTAACFSCCVSQHGVSFVLLSQRRECVRALQGGKGAIYDRGVVLFGAV
jgi:hypothetical protein